MMNNQKKYEINTPFTKIYDNIATILLNNNIIKEKVKIKFLLKLLSLHNINICKENKLNLELIQRYVCAFRV